MLVRTYVLREGENVRKSVNFPVAVDFCCLFCEYSDTVVSKKIKPYEILKLYQIDVRVWYNMWYLVSFISNFLTCT